MKYLWDTNTVIYYLQQQYTEKAEKLIDDTLKESVPIISTITEIELLCWKTASEKDLEIMQHFIDDSIVIELDRAIKMKTAELRRTYSIKLPDAIIAATAIVYNLKLISRNKADFQKIKELNFIDPFLV